MDYCPPGNIYFVMAILCRCVAALGASMGLSYALVGFYFPNRISSIVALLEVFTGFGLMVILKLKRLAAISHIAHNC